MFRKIMCFVMILVLAFSISVSANSDIENLREGNLPDVSNIDPSIPQRSIISQEIVYIGGVPVLFETYEYDGLIVDIGSLLELTATGYRIVESHDEINFPMPRNFIDMVLAVHDEMRQIEPYRVTASEIPGISIEVGQDEVTFIQEQLEQVYDDITPLGTNRWSHHHGQHSSTPMQIGGIGGFVVPGTRVEHWFDWQMRSDFWTQDVMIGNGGKRASVLQVSPASTIAITESITINRLAVSLSWPPGFGVGFTPTMRTRSFSQPNVLFVAYSRGSFTNRFQLPLPFVDLVTISTSATSSVRVGTGAHFGRTAETTARFRSF